MKTINRIEKNVCDVKTTQKEVTLDHTKKFNCINAGIVGLKRSEIFKLKKNRIYSFFLSSIEPYLHSLCWTFLV